MDITCSGRYCIYATNLLMINQILMFPDVLCRFRVELGNVTY